MCHLKERNIIIPPVEQKPDDIHFVYDDVPSVTEVRDAVHAAPSSSRKAAGIILKLLAVGMIAFILWHQFADVKIDVVLGLLDRVGFAVFLVLIPPTLELFAETLGLALCVPGSLSVMRIIKVLPARIGCDALINSLPAGVVPAETLRPVMIGRACRLPIEDGVAATLMGKINMAAGEGLFIAITMVLVAIGGHAYGGALSGSTVMIPVIVLALVFAGVAYIYSGARITQIISLLKRIAWERWRRFLSGIELGAGRIDATILHFARRDRISVFASLASFVIGWVLLGSESFLILRILGEHVTLGQGLLMEGTVSILRIAFFFIPSAFGAAEAAYASLITAYGVANPAAVALAFIAIKRSQELLWMGLGYLALLVSGRRKTTEALLPREGA